VKLKLWPGLSDPELQSPSSLVVVWLRAGAVFVHCTTSPR
jgi:hypothetical protein